MKAKVSVIIPVYNRRHELERAVRSVLSQTYPEFELLVIDDGSTDDLSVVEKLVRDSGQRFFTKARGGVSSARNLGIHEACGDWFAFLDSDDVWLAEKLERQMDYLRANPLCRICQTEERWIRNGRFVNPKKCHDKACGNAFVRSLELCCISPSSVVVCRDLLLEGGGFDEQMRVCEDYDLWLRITARHEVGLVDEVLVKKHGGHADQLSRSEPVMDRFRVYSMVKLLVEEELSEWQVRAVIRELGRKSEVIASGALKRDRDKCEELYRSVSEQAHALLLDDGELSSAAKEGFSSIFPLVRADIA